MADMLFELYRLLVEEVREARRARRELSNVFMTMNLAGVGALGFLSKGNGDLHPALLGWCCIALVLTCIIWRLSNAYYTGMLATKYEIIYEVERDLGMNPLQREWGGLPRKGLMKWFSFERAMPLLFIFGYFVFLAYEISIDDVQTMFDAFWAPARDLLERVRS
jgi:hypothetical protein